MGSNPNNCILLFIFFHPTHLPMWKDMSQSKLAMAQIHVKGYEPIKSFQVGRPHKAKSTYAFGRKVCCNQSNWSYTCENKRANEKPPSWIQAIHVKANKPIKSLQVATNQMEAILVKWNEPIKCLQCSYKLECICRVEREIFWQVSLFTILLLLLYCN